MRDGAPAEKMDGVVKTINLNVNLKEAFDLLGHKINAYEIENHGRKDDESAQVLGPVCTDIHL